MTDPLRPVGRPRPLPTLTLFLVLVLTTTCGGDPRQDAAEHQQLALELTAALAEGGYPVDLERLTIEVRDTDDCRQDMLAQQRLFFRESHFIGFHALLSALGLAFDGQVLDPDGPDQLLDAVADQLVSQMAAYYQADRQALVFPRSLLNSLAEGLGQRDHVVAHELVHAWQDQQRGGLVELLAAAGRTREQVELARTLMEGEAEVVAMELVLRRQGQDLEAVDESTLDLTASLEGALSPASLAYDTGRRVVLAAHQRGGRAAVDALFDRRPPSTEQLLHPAKLGQDTPVDVPADAWRALWPDATLVHDDVVGEQALRLMLTPFLDRERAFRAATGWDGDRLVVLDLAGGERVAHWRSVWDRDEDARQMAEALERAGDGRAHVEGRVLDVFAGPPEVTDRWHAALPAWTAPADPADALTTAAAEEGFQGTAGHTEGDRWVRDDAGLSLRIPPGWTAATMNGMAALQAPPGGGTGFGDNVTAMRLPNPLGTDPETHIRMTREQFEAMPMGELLSIEARDIGGLPGLAFHSTLEFQPGRLLHSHGRVALSDAHQVVVTATVSADRAEELADDVEAILESLAWLDED